MAAHNDDKVLTFFHRTFAGDYRKFFLLYPLGAVGWLAGLAQFVDQHTLFLVICGVAAVYYSIFTLAAAAAFIVQRQRSKNLAKELAQIRGERDQIGVAFAKSLRDNPAIYRHISWIEKIVVSENGDTVIEREVEASPGQDGMGMFFVSLYGNKPADTDDRVQFKSWIVKGDEVREPARFLSAWESETKFAAFIFLDRVYRKGETVRVRCWWNWPKYSTSIAKGDPESHSIKLSRDCESFQCTIVLKKHGTLGKRRILAEANQGLGFTAKPDVSCAETPDEHTITMTIAQQTTGAVFGVRILPYEEETQVEQGAKALLH